MPKLIYFSTDGKWLEYPLGELTRIGRHPDQDLQLLDRMISKAHAEIAHIGANYVLRDVGSRNGTVLNEETVTSPVILRDGDEISVGNHVLRFVLDLDGETDPKTTSKTEHISSAVERPDLRSESPFVLRRRGGQPDFSFRSFAACVRMSIRVVGSPYPQKTISS